MFGIVLPDAPEATCETCGAWIAEGKKYCNRVCYYARNSATAIPKDTIAKFDPIAEQLAEEGIVIDGESAEFCVTCGAPKYQGRCSRFTQHKPPRKPRSR